MVASPSLVRSVAAGQPDREHAAGGGHDHHAQALELEPLGARRRAHPGREAHQQRARPARGCPAGRPRRRCPRPPEAGRCRRRPAMSARPAPISDPRRAGPPAREAEDGDHDARAARGPRPGRRGSWPPSSASPEALSVDDPLERQRRRQRRHGERGDRAVEPEAAAEAGHPGPHQQREGDVAGGVEGEVAGVGERRDRHLVPLREDRGVVDLPGGPGRAAPAPISSPCRALLAVQRGAEQAGARRRPGAGRCRPRVEEVVEARRRPARGRRGPRRRARRHPPRRRRRSRSGVCRVERDKGSTCLSTAERGWFSAGIGRRIHCGADDPPVATTCCPTEKEAPADAEALSHQPAGAGGPGAPGGRGAVDLPARRLARAPQGRADRPRGAGRDRRPGDADAGAHPGGAVAAQRPLRDRRAVQAQGPPRTPT